MAAAVLIFLPAGTDAAEPWPGLRFGRIVPVAPADEARLKVGGTGALASSDGRLAVDAVAGVGFGGPLTRGIGLEGALFALQGVRGSRTVHAVGHGRLAATWRAADRRWSAAAGSSFWVGDEGLGSWFGSASPFAAAAYHPGPVTVGATFTWDRSDYVAPFDPVALWAEDARPGLRPGATVGRGWGPIDASLSYELQLDAATGALRSDVATADLSYPIAFSLATLTPVAFVRTPIVDGFDPYPVTAGLVVRLDFGARALWSELFGGAEEAAGSADAAATFDPFAD